MSKKVFTVGDRVASFVNDYDGEDLSTKIVFKDDCYPVYGLVTDILSSGKVAVTWDQKDSDILNESDPIVEPKILMLEDEMKTQFSKLEIEFEEVQDQVLAKMKEAGKLLREASKLAKKMGTNLSDMDTGPLYSAMDACGWRTSSFGC